MLQFFSYVLIIQMLTHITFKYDEMHVCIIEKFTLLKLR